MSKSTPTQQQMNDAARKFVQPPRPRDRIENDKGLEALPPPFGMDPSLLGEALALVFLDGKFALVATPITHDTEFRVLERLNTASGYAATAALIAQMKKRIHSMRLDRARLDDMNLPRLTSKESQNGTDGPDSGLDDLTPAEQSA